MKKIASITIAVAGIVRNLGRAAAGRLQRAHPRRDDLRRLWRRALRRRCRAQGRQDRLCRTARAGTRARVVDASGKAVSPGFINMLSWANESLIADGRGPQRHRSGRHARSHGRRRFDGTADRRDEAAGAAAAGRHQISDPVDHARPISRILQRKGITPNVASFVGATTVRRHELGEKDVDPTPAQLMRMRALVRQAMKEGAMGVGSSLIYAPANYAETPELVAITTEAGKCGGMYISHMRSEGNKLLEAIDELIAISKQSGAPAEIYHFKQGGKPNWGKLDAAIAKVEAAPARPASASPPTCTPTPPVRRASTPPCRRGCSPAGSRRGSSG